MEDLIRRSDAIDIIEKLQSNAEMDVVIGTLQAAKSALKGLPSAEPYTDEEIQKMQDMEQAQLEKAFELGREDAKAEIVRCKDCKHFEYDHPYLVQGVPVLGHLVCNKWGDGCRTSEDGFCFLAERRTDE